MVTAAASAHLRRPLTLIAESDQNDPGLVTPRQSGGLGIDAQWSDDFHHGLHVALTGEAEGYYAEFTSLGALAAAVRAWVRARPGGCAGRREQKARRSWTRGRFPAGGW